MGGVNSQVVLTEEEVEAVIRDLGNLLAPFLVRMNWLRSVNRRNLMIRHLYPADCSGVPSSSGDGKTISRLSVAVCLGGNIGSCWGVQESAGF